MIQTGQASRVEISKRLVLINSASAVGTRLLSMSVLIWLQQYLLKRVSPEEYSLLPVLYSVMAFAPLLTTILTGGIGRYITVAYARGDDNGVTRIVSTMFPILCAAGVLFLGAGWFLAWHIDSVLIIAPNRVNDARIMMAILMLSAAVRLPLAPFSAGFFVRQKFMLENLIGIGTELFRLALLFSLLFGVSARVLWVITAATSAEFVNLAITRTISMRLVPALRFRRSQIHWPIAGEITAFGGWSFLGEIANTVRTASDALILNRFATPIDVAAFHIGSMVPRYLSSLSLQALGPLLPALTAMVACGDTARIRETCLRVGRYALWGSMTLVVPALVFHGELAVLYAGPAYKSAGTVLMLLLVLYPIFYGMILTPSLANARGEVGAWTRRTIIRESANLAGTLFLVGYLKLGAAGSAFSTALMLVIFQPLLIYPLALRFAETDWSTWASKTLLPGLAPAALSLLAGFMARQCFASHTWLSIAICCAVMEAAYCLALFVFCLDRKEKTQIAGLAQKVMQLGRVAT